MGKLTQILVKSKECTELGFPKKFGVFEIGEARKIGPYFNVAVLVLRQDGLQIPRPPVELEAATDEAARELVIRHYKGLADEMKLDILVTELGSC
jgi:hypothetical protein